MSTPPTLGLILAGGRAQRLGGGDKARIRVGRTTIFERVLACLAPQCSHIILNANGDLSRFADTRLPVVADGTSDYNGPLPAFWPVSIGRLTMRRSSNGW